MFKKFLFLTVLACLACTRALALELYSGEVTVAGQGAGERLEAVPTALIQVLQKHSGQRELPVNETLDAALLSASRIMVSFHYRDYQKTAPDGSVSNEWRLVANFLPEAVDRMVRELQLPRWRSQRDPITIWIVVDDGLGRRLMPLEYEYAWDALLDVAERRGLPILWPELGDDQLAQVDLQLLWGGFADELSGNADNQDVVIVAARREGPVWNVRWNFAGGDETSAWRTRDVDLSFALVDGLHRLTDLVASRDSIAASGLGQWQAALRVRGFRTSADYAKCLAYLEGLGVVEGVVIDGASPDTIDFTLELNALPQYLAREFERDKFLIAGIGEGEYILADAVMQLEPDTEMNDE